MAASLSCARFACRIIRPSVIPLSSAGRTCTHLRIAGSVTQHSAAGSILTQCPVVLSVTRNYSYISENSIDDLWKGMSGISSQGQKKGRSRSAGLRKPVLYKGRKWSQGDFGKFKKVYSDTCSKELTEEQKQARQKKLAFLDAESMSSRKRVREKIPALQRGYSGIRIAGCRIGPPEPIGEYTFDGFESVVLQSKIVTCMTANKGRARSFRAIVVTGNGKGLAGYAKGSSSTMRGAIKNARKRAAQHLQYIELYDNATVYHNFHNKERQTAVFVKRQARGYGLICHRVIKSICQVIGIKDLYAKSEGRVTNTLSLTRAFFNGLRTQETHQELADRMKLHVVEFSEQKKNIPYVVASPSDGKVTTIQQDRELLDFETLYFGGRLPYERPKRQPFYYKTPAWYKKYIPEYRARNQSKAQLERRVFGLEPSKAELRRRASKDK